MKKVITQKSNYKSYGIVTLELANIIKSIEDYTSLKNVGGNYERILKGFRFR